MGNGIGKGKQMSGFTLIEAVATLLVLSVIAIAVVRFIGFSAQGYIDTSKRNQLSAAGRVVIERLAMELHNALPNSVRIEPEPPPALADPGEQCLEYFPVLAATTYIDPPFRPSPGTTTFTVVKVQPADIDPAFAVIYPRGESDIYQDMPLPTTGHIAAVESITAHPSIPDVDVVTLTPSHTFRRRSAESRVYLVDNPVSYCVDGDRLYRYSGYELTAAEHSPADLPATTAQGRVLIATDVDQGDTYTAFDYSAPTLRRNAIVQLEFNFSREDESVTMNHEVTLHSAP